MVAVADFEDKFRIAIKKKIGQYFGSRAKIDAVKFHIRTSVRRRILESDFITALLNNHSIVGHLGLTRPEQAANAITKAVADSVIVTYQQSDRTVIRIFILRKDFKEVLSIPDARFLSQPSNDVIEWLEWMLFGGKNVIIADYAYIFNNHTIEYSRTGQGIMRQGGSWAVPEFNGTQNDNFLTRALRGIATESDGNQDSIADIFKLVYGTN